MKLTSESKILIGILTATVGIIALAVVVMSQPAKPLDRQSLLPADSTTRGNASASAYLVEFSDFQCPACKAVKPVVDEIVKTYGDRLVFSYRHFPLPQHIYAQKAAIAAEAASRQGKFWEMYDLLFANSESLSDDMVTGFVTQIGLNRQQFTKDLSDPAVTGLVNRDRDYATSIGVNATPTFFLNGVKLNLSSFANLKTEVKKGIQ